MNGKQVRVKRPPTVDGMPVEEFIARNADPIWLHQNGMWEYMQPPEEPDENQIEPLDHAPFPDDDVPF